MSAHIVWYGPGSPLPEAASIVQLEGSATRLGFNFRLDTGLVGGLRPSLAALGARLKADAPEAYRAAAARRNQELVALKEREVEAQRARIEKNWDRHPLSMSRVMAEIRDAMPAQTVVVDETITASLDLLKSFEFHSPGDYFSGRGGGIGQGLAGALGVKLALPARPVVAISGDGSAMYSIQALWTAARHDLAIVFIILANKEYRVLKHNLDIYRQRFDALSNQDYPEMGLGGPDLGFVEMAGGMGLAGTRVVKGGELGPAIESAFASGRPHLIEVEIESKR